MYNIKNAFLKRFINVHGPFRMMPPLRRSALAARAAGRRRLPVSRPGSTDNFYGVNRSLHATRLAGVVQDFSDRSIEEALIDITNLQAEQGGSPGKVFTNYRSYGSLVKALGAKVQLVVGQVDAGLATAKSVVDQDGTSANRMEYALLLLAADREEQGMTELEALAGGSSETAAVVERLKALRDLEAGRFDAARGRFEKLIQQGAHRFRILTEFGAAGVDGGLDHAVSRNNSRPISKRRISLVPAPISYSLASRHRRPRGYSLM